MPLFCLPAWIDIFHDGRMSALRTMPGTGRQEIPCSIDPSLLVHAPHFGSRKPVSASAFRADHDAATLFFVLHKKSRCKVLPNTIPGLSVMLSLFGILAEDPIMPHAARRGVNQFMH